MRKLMIVAIAGMALVPGCGSGGGGSGGNGGSGAAFGTPPSDSSANADSPVGTNLAMLRFWSTQWVFVDAFKQ